MFGIVFDKAGEWIFIVFALGKNYTTSTFESILQNAAVLQPMIQLFAMFSPSPHHYRLQDNSGLVGRMYCCTVTAGFIFRHNYATTN